MSSSKSNQVVLHVDPKFMKRVPDPHDPRRWNYVGTITGDGGYQADPRYCEPSERQPWAAK